MSTSPEPKSRRPAGTKFKQQNLPAWKPILTPRTVLPTFFGIGVAFIIIGAVLLSLSNDVNELEFEYTDCIDTAGTPSSTNTDCATLLGNFDNNYTNNIPSNPYPASCICDVKVQFDKGFSGDTYIFYSLENYFQNHRRYVKSRWDPQLRSKQANGGEDCDPLEEENGKYYAPCGLVANSLFNDTIEVYQCPGALSSCTVGASSKVTLDGTDISWKSDRDTKFQNPSVPAGQDLCDVPTFSAVNSIRPPNYPLNSSCQLGTDVIIGANNKKSPWSPTEFKSSGRGYENEDFIVWMRVAALPDFRKLYRKFVTTPADGAYIFRIGYNYPVAAFDGKKKIIVSTTSVLGGKNPFLGICYLVVGLLSVFIGSAFLLYQHYGGRRRQLGDISYLKWDK